MSPAARQGWRDALAALLLYFSLLALCDPAPEATMETHMETKHSQGPFRATVRSTSGFTTIHDAAGAAIGCATAYPGMEANAVEANGRIFAASHTLCAAVTEYMEACDRAVDGGEGFTDEILWLLGEAKIEALNAFDIILGKKGARP